MKSFIVLLLLLSPVIGWAQTVNITPADLQRKQSYLLMRDGTVLKGQILRQDSTLISVRRRGGDLSFVEADQVVRIMANRPEEYSPNVPVDVVLARPVRLNRVFVLKDGSRVEGQFVRRDSTMITVRKTNGQLTYFEPELLVRMDSVQAEPFGELDRTFPNRFSPWLLTGLTAFNPEKGRFYYRNTWLLLNEFQYGITRFWSVGAKFVTPIPYLVLADGYYGTGQYTGNLSQLITKFSAALSPDFHLGVNAAFQRSQYSSSATGGRWTLQALATIGSSQHNVTVGYGIVVPRVRQFIYYVPQPGWPLPTPRYPYVTIPNRSFLALGIMQKIGPNLTLLSDNSINLGQQRSYYYDNTGERASVSAALRIDRRRHAFDLGAYALIYQKPRLWENDRRTRFFPYVGYNLLIGRD